MVELFDALFRKNHLRILTIIIANAELYGKFSQSTSTHIAISAIGANILGLK